LRDDYEDEVVFFHDELRAGTRTELSRKWTPMGHRPIAPVKIGYENTYLYLTICPFTGKGFGAFLPKLNSEWFGWFVKKVEECIEQKALFIADGATAHKTELFDKEKLVFERLPAACPELNPVERFFKEIRKQLKNKIFDTLQQAQEKIQLIVEKLFDEEEKVSSLTCFPYLKNTT
jgi:transposase